MSVLKSTQTQTSLPKFAFIDALRGWAFVGVMCSHVVSRAPGVPPWLTALLGSGGEGVQLFFLISAFTLFSSLDSRTKLEPRPVTSFFIRRYFRIAPLFYCAAFFYFWFDNTHGDGSHSGSATAGCFLSTLTFTNGWSIAWINRLVPGGWSVAVEMNFYLLVPFLFRRVRSFREAINIAFVLFILGAAASAVVKVLIVRFSGPGSEEAAGRFAWYWLPAQIPVFFLGIALYWLLKPVLKGNGEMSVRPNPTLLLAISAYMIAAASLSKFSLYLGHALFVTAFFLLAWSLCLRPTRWLVNPITRYIGKVSFSAYICHFAVLDLVDQSWGLWAPTELSPPGRLVILLVTVLAGTVAISTATYYLIEVPGQAVGRAAITKLNRKTNDGSAKLD